MYQKTFSSYFLECWLHFLLFLFFYQLFCINHYLMKRLNLCFPFFSPNLKASFKVHWFNFFYFLSYYFWTEITYFIFIFFINLRKKYLRIISYFWQVTAWIYSFFINFFWILTAFIDLFRSIYYFSQVFKSLYLHNLYCLNIANDLNHFFVYIFYSD